MKKKILSFMVLAVAACISVGCANNNAKKEGNGGESANSDYPKKPIQLIVPYAAGGGTDTVARAIGNEVQNELGQSVAVQNVTGGSGAVGFQQGINSKADGYTLTMTTVELLTLPQLGVSNFKYTDFRPIALLNKDPAAITVRADAPWDTIEDFIEYAKKNDVKVGNSGVGAIWHMAAIAFQNETGAKFVHTPYDGAAPAVTALLGGHVDAVTVSPGEVYTQVQSGDFKVLAVMSDERVKQLPDVPTLKEKGIDLSIGTWRGICVPKETPDDICSKLEGAFIKASETDAYKSTLEKLNLGYASMKSEEFSKFLEQQNTQFEELSKSIDINK